MYLKFVVFVSIIGGTWAASCPPAEEILPCKCEEEKLRFYCSNQGSTEPWDIKATFDQITQLVPPDFIFDDLSITATNLETIPAGTVQSLKFNKINLYANNELSNIHPDAFGETVNVTTTLLLQSNDKITDDVYILLTKFQAATLIDVHDNGINSIPDGGFGPLPNLELFSLTGDHIRIGSKAFSQLPKLVVANMDSCDITLEEIADDAFVGVGPKAEILMKFNPFPILPENKFKPLFDDGVLLIIGGETCVWLGFWYCQDQRFDCDENADWICQDVEKYQTKVKGFLCRSTSRYDDIWDYCARKASNE